MRAAVGRRMGCSRSRLVMTPRGLWPRRVRGLQGTEFPAVRSLVGAQWSGLMRPSAKARQAFLQAPGDFRREVESRRPGSRPARRR